MKKTTIKRTRSSMTAAASVAGQRKQAGSAMKAKPAGGRAQNVVVIPLGNAEDCSSSTAAGVWLRAVPRASGSR